MAKKFHKKKPGTEIILPGATEIYQPNRVTNGKYKSLSLLQSRILLSLIKELQNAILASLNGKNWLQLNLFEITDRGLIRVPIRLKEISKPNHYTEVYKATLQLSKINIKLPSSVGKDYYCIAVLFPKVHFPIIENRCSIIYVEILPGVARKLIEIEFSSTGRPSFFTKYLYEVAMSATNKFTYKLYMLISSWKSKGGFRISLHNLKEQLGISPDQYISYREFKKRVLIPAQKDLEYKSDCWFNCNIDGFEERKNQKVDYLNFKIIVPAPKEVIEKRKDHLQYLLRTHFQFSDVQLKEISPALTNIIDDESFDYLLNKLQEIKEYITQRRGTKNEIISKPNYVLSILKKISGPAS